MQRYNPSPPPFPLVPSSITTPETIDLIKSFYEALSDDLRRLFVRVMRHLWNYQSAVKSSYFGLFWIMNQQRINNDMKIGDISVLSFIYYASRSGRSVLRSSSVYSGAIEGMSSIFISACVLRLIKLGFVSRSLINSDGLPYLKKNRSNRPVFIKITDKGIKFIQSFDRAVNSSMIQRSINDLTGE